MTVRGPRSFVSIGVMWLWEFTGDLVVLVNIAASLPGLGEAELRRWDGLYGGGSGSRELANRRADVPSSLDPAAPDRRRGLEEFRFPGTGEERTTGRSGEGAKSMGPVSQEHPARAAWIGGGLLSGCRRASSHDGDRYRSGVSSVFRFLSDRGTVFSARTGGCDGDRFDVPVAQRSGGLASGEWMRGRSRPDAPTGCLRELDILPGADGLWSARAGVSGARTTVRRRVLTFVDGHAVADASSRDAATVRPGRATCPVFRSFIASRSSARTLSLLSDGGQLAGCRSCLWPLARALPIHGSPSSHSLESNEGGAGKRFRTAFPRRVFESY